MNIPTLLPTNWFNFDGIQYLPYFLMSGSGDNPPSSILMNIPTLLPKKSFNFDGIQYSSYFLTSGSGDNPGSSIISEVLDDTNYCTWILAITIALDAKNKLCFVDGSLPRPPKNHPYYRTWFRWNSMVKSWILNSVTKRKAAKPAQTMLICSIHT